MPWHPSHHDRQVSLLVERHGLSSYEGSRWGIGRTQVPKSKTARGIPEWASAVEEVLDLLHIDQCSVMAHSAGAPYALSFANKVPERIRGEILLLAPWVGGVEGGLSYLPKSRSEFLSPASAQPVTNGSSTSPLVYLRPPRPQSGKSRLGCLANLQHLPTEVLAMMPSLRCQRHLITHLHVDIRIRTPPRHNLFPSHVLGDVLALLRVSLVITMTCEISRVGSIVEVLLALEALAPNVVAR